MKAYWKRHHFDMVGMTQQKQGIKKGDVSLHLLCAWLLAN